MSQDLKEVTRIMNLYIDGTGNGNADQMNEAFHSSAHWFGAMDGVIANISADAVSSEERGQTQYYYIARVETSSSVMNSLGKKLPIIPGMQAQVDVITGHKTVLRYLLKPIIGVKENAFRER